MINVFQPSLGSEELKEIKKIFDSNWLGKGPVVNKFEEAFAHSLKAPSSNFISTTCCTEALFLATELFGLDESCEVIVPSISFVAVANSLLAKGAHIVLCDVDPRSLNATIEHIENKVSTKTKALFLNHYGGVPCELDPILALCKSKNILLIEDSACAVHSFYKEKACGTFGDMGMWSFDAAKILVTGDGGMMFLKSPDQLLMAKELLYHGLPDKQSSGFDSSKTGTSNWWEFDVHHYGRRAIMNDITACMGMVQLGKLKSFIARRKEISEIYTKELSPLDWLFLPPSLPDYVQSCYYTYWVQLKERDRLAKFLYERNVYTTFRYWPLHRIKHFHLATDQLPHSDYVSNHTLNIPLHQSLTNDEVYKIINYIYDFGKTI